MKFQPPYPVLIQIAFSWSFPSFSVIFFEIPEDQRQIHKNIRCLLNFFKIVNSSFQHSSEGLFRQKKHKFSVKN